MGAAPPRIAVGLIAAPGLPADVGAALADDLIGRLKETYPDVEWQVPVVTDPLVEPPAHTTELIDAAHQRLLREDWEIALCVTDLPLRIHRRAVIGHASATHRVAVLSVPALGPTRLRRRALDAATDLVKLVLGEPRETGSLRRRLVDLADLADEDPDHGPSGLAAIARGGNLRLLAGMVRANRPWRLAVRLYRALVGALAAVAFALVTSDIWRISASLSPVRLAAITVLSVALTVGLLIAAHGLWEPARAGRARDQVALFNAATATTVALGILSLYVALFALSLAGAGLFITPETLSSSVHPDAGFGDYLKLAWLVSSLATVGGALGAGLESDVAVREAAYAYRPG
jgi:hypothetical protein